MSYLLRRLPLSRLLLLCGLVVVLGISITALAFALGTGPTPPPKPLADAVHDALAGASGQPIEGVSASIQLTDHLLEGASLASGGGGGGEASQLASSPLLSGASGRLWISKDGHVRLELQSEKGDTQIYYDGHTVQMYDASSNTLYRYTPPAHEGGSGSRAGSGSGSESGSGSGATNPHHEVPSVAKIEEAISHLSKHANVSGATPTDIAGQAAYTVRVTPKETGSLLGGAELSWDAVHGVPLRAAIYSTNSSSPMLELAATSISYGPVAASVFEFTPPSNAKVAEVTLPDQGDTKPAPRPKAANSPKVTTQGHGLSTIAVLERQGESRWRKRILADPARRPAEGQDQRHRSDRAAHRAGHAAQLRALGRALPARRRGRPGGARSGRPGPVAVADEARPAGVTATENAAGDMGEAQPVRARGLVKRYKEVLAVDHIDLNVRAGDVYGFLGPNGAGKTTTLRMALGLIMPTEGTVRAVRARPDARGRPRPGGRRGVRGGAALLPISERAQEPGTAGRARRRRRAGAYRGGAGDRRADARAPSTASAATRTACASAWGSPPRCCAARAC